MTNDRQPPPHVAEAARIVDGWLRGQGSVLDTGGTPQPRPETAAQRFAKLDRSQPPRSDLPAWKDPRTK
jgi:hypothetical protein